MIKDFDFISYRLRLGKEGKKETPSDNLNHV